MLRKVDHVIMLVENVEQAAADYRKILGLMPEDGKIRDLPQARIAMFPVPSGARIELVERKKPDRSRFAEFIGAHGEGVMGLSIFMDDFDRELEELKKKGVEFTLEEQNTLHAGHPFRMAWVPPQQAHGVWLEIVDAAALPPHLRD